VIDIQTYIVKKGDTLYGISNQYGVSVTELASLNGVDASTLQIGQELVIPDKSGVNPNNMFLYTVKKGDTLYSIAKKYNTSVSAILDLNYLTNTNLSIGQVIRIPENYTPEGDITLPQYTNYIVQKGDTLYSISKKFQISIDVLVKDNALTTTVLYPGEILKIRTNSNEVLECFGEDYTPPNNNDNIITYTVQKGDSLYSISRKFNTSVDQIMKLNNLSSNLLSIGQILKIKRGI
jgi:peptidoglycan endopeptidase LytF